jgi:hypothetical protein
MMLLVLLSGLSQDAAEAGFWYRQAQESILEGRYEEAVGRLQQALRSVPRETDKLLYRDRQGRHKEPYYPHYLWGQARTLEAQSQSDPLRRRSLLREAVTHLELSEHPQVGALLADVKKELSTLEKAEPPPDAASVALGERVKALLEKERFEEALEVVKLEKAGFERDPSRRKPMIEAIELQQRSVLARYRRTLDLALEAVAATSSLEKFDSIPQLLESAIPPRTVIAQPDRSFRWAEEFLSLCRSASAGIRGQKSAQASEVLALARSFERAAQSAYRERLFAGFRAAQSLAHAIRGARLRLLAGGQNEGELEPVLADSELALATCERLLTEPSGGSKEIESYRVEILVPYAGGLRQVREQARERIRLQAELQAWMALAEGTLSESRSMADPETLRGIAAELRPFEIRAAWREAPPGLRARALWIRGMVEGIAGILAGEDPDVSLERVASHLKAARALDPQVGDPWKGRLSPKLTAWLDRMDR